MSIVKGEKFSIDIIEGAQERIDSEKVRELLGPTKVLEVTKNIPTETVKTTRISGSKPEFRIPILDNLTPEGIADLLGTIREQMANDKKLEGIYKDKLKALIKKAELDRLEAEEKARARAEAKAAKKKEG